MSFGALEDYEVEEDEVYGQTPEIDEPDFEEVFQVDPNEFIGPRQRFGNERISKPFLGKLAKARLIAARAGQLQLGAPPAIPRGQLKSSELSEIAKEELEKRVIPIKIVRKFADGSFEIWPITDFKYIVRD